MEDNDYVLAFDHFYTTNHIQILKSLIPFMENGSSQMLPALIKYMELKHTLSMIQSGKRPISQGISACSSSPFGQGASELGDNLEQIYNAIHRYLAPGEEKSFHQILSAFRTMKNVQEMQQMMELMQSLNPDMDFSSGMENIGNMGNMNLNDVNINNINDMMQLFQSMNNNNINNN